MNSREKRLLLLIILLGLALSGKSMVEGYKMLPEASASERGFYKWVLEKQIETYNGDLYESGVLSIKLISIQERQQEETTYYVAKMRKYLLKVIPFSDIYIKEEKGKFEVK